MRRLLCWLFGNHQWRYIGRRGFGVETQMGYACNHCGKVKWE